MADAERIAVEVVYALPNRQLLVKVHVPAGSTAEQAVRLSGMLERFPEIDLECAKLGIFGRRTKPDHVLSAGDRIEIYRELIADPKAARRKRVEGTARRR